MQLVKALRRKGRTGIRAIREPEIRNGMVTPWGMKLSVIPSLSSDPQVKFAAFDDPRICDPEHYDEFARFLPEEFVLLGPPKRGQNCFGYCFKLIRAFPMGFECWLPRPPDAVEESPHLAVEIEKLALGICEACPDRKL